MNLILYKQKAGLILIILTIIWALLLACYPQGSQLNIFYARTNDLFADFFNVMIYIADRNPYFNEINGFGEKCYLPLTYLLIYPFSYIENYSDMSLQDCWNSPTAMISCVIYVLVSLVVFIHSYIALLKQSLLDYRIYIFVLCSSIVLFSIERANTIVLTVAFVNYFLAFYQSDNKKLRTFALVSLCMAAVLKIYPVLLGVLLLRERRFKDIGFTIVFSVIITFLPFLFFKHGFDNIMQLLSNVQMNSGTYGPERIYPRFGLAPLLHLPLQAIHVSSSFSHVVFTIANIIVALASILSIFLALVEKRKWVSIALLLFVIIQFPTNSALYSGMYLFPFVALFLSKGETDWFDGLFMILIIVALCPLQLVVKSMSFNYLITNTSVLLMWFILIFFSIKSVLSQSIRFTIIKF